MIWLAAYAAFIAITWGMWRHGSHNLAIVFGLVVLAAIILETRRHARSIRERR